MGDLLELSARIIDNGDTSTPTNRMTTELSEVAEGIAVVEAFSHVWALATEGGLVLFDTSLAAFGEPARAAVRAWSDDPVAAIVYTHGHVDHVGGARAWLDEATRQGRPSPPIVAHSAVARRFERYDRTNGYNARINQRQFRLRAPSFPRDWVRPTVTYTDRLLLGEGEDRIELRHGRGETDDHTWAWVPERRAIFAGDFFIWNFPNAGNPQKVQRYPLEWAHTLRQMAALEPELFLPAHGLPIGGAARIASVLATTAGALESIVEQTLALMNEGARLDEVIHSVELDPGLLELPYLQPLYDEPEFVVRNVWRMYGGWWDGRPSSLKPAPDARLAEELASLAGGARVLAERGRALAEAGDLRLACHLVDLAVDADPHDADAHRARAAVYEQRRREELSVMAKGIYRAAAEESADRAGVELDAVRSVIAPGRLDLT